MSIVYHINKISELLEKQEECDEKIKRYSLFPILDEEAYEFYQRQEMAHWSATELDFTSDIPCYQNLNEKEKNLVDIILAFFLIGDGVICKNIVFRFLLECKTFEESAMFISQLHIELIHSETYNLAAFTFKKDSESLANLISSAENTPCVKRKIKFMEDHMHEDTPRHIRLVVYACSEGIFFCTSFAAIFWFRSKGLLNNFITSNELIAKDESLHRNYGVFLRNREIKQLNNTEEIKEQTIKLVKEAVAIEEEFCEQILPESIDDFNAEDLKTYTKLIADGLLIDLGYEPIYNVKNPFTWMDGISFDQKSNFYEVRTAAYKKRSFADILNWKKRAGVEYNNTDPYQDDIEF